MRGKLSVSLLFAEVAVADAVAAVMPDAADQSQEVVDKNSTRARKIESLTR